MADELAQLRERLARVEAAAGDASAAYSAWSKMPNRDTLTNTEDAMHWLKSALAPEAKEPTNSNGTT